MRLTLYHRSSYEETPNERSCALVAAVVLRGDRRKRLAGPLGPAAAAAVADVRSRSLCTFTSSISPHLLAPSPHLSPCAVNICVCGPAATAAGVADVAAGAAVSRHMRKTRYQVCGMVCWRYGTMARCRGCTNYVAKFAWYGMFQYIRSVRVDYVVQLSSVTTLYPSLESVRKYKPCRQTDRQTNRFAITAAETQFYKLRV